MFPIWRYPLAAHVGEGRYLKRRMTCTTCLPVGKRSRHLQRCGRMSLPYISGQAVCCEPHQESGPIGKALFQAEVTKQGTEENTVSPAPQPSGLFGRILCPVVQQGVQEIHATREARVIRVRNTGRAAKTPKLALRASFKTIAGDVPF